MLCAPSGKTTNPTATEGCGQTQEMARITSIQISTLEFLGCVQNPISNEPKHNGKDALK